MLGGIAFVASRATAITAVAATAAWLGSKIAVQEKLNNQRDTLVGLAKEQGFAVEFSVPPERFPMSRIEGTWMYGDATSIASFIPLCWSKQVSLLRLKKLISKAEEDRPIQIRFYSDSVTLLLDEIFLNKQQARIKCDVIAVDGLSKVTRDSWDPWNLSGPEGMMKQGLRNVPLLGHVVKVREHSRWMVS